MIAERWEGTPLALAVQAECAERVQELARRGVTPTLALVRVGEDPASLVYLRKKREACETVGVHSYNRELPATTTQAELTRVIDALNADAGVHGILVQFPLPAGLSEEAAILAIDPDKDVDGFHPLNAGRLASGLPGFVPCTPLGIHHLLKRAGVPTAGRHAVVIGRSNIVGRPMANLLTRKGVDATVTLCHSRSGDIAAFTRRADIVIAAVGRAGTLTGDMLKPGVVVIDVGMNRVADPATKSGTRLVGDVDAASVIPVAARLTPVPGGVGPLTVAFLIRNTVAAAAGERSAL